MSEQTSKGMYGELWEAREDGAVSGGVAGGDVLEISDYENPLDGSPMLKWASPDHQHRAVACVNALAGIPDPEAFMRKYGEMREALVSVIDALSGRVHSDAAMKSLGAARAALSDSPAPALKQDVTDLIEVVARLCNHTDHMGESFPRWLNGLRQLAEEARAALELYRKGETR